jgi:hypothetical protein
MKRRKKAADPSSFFSLFTLPFTSPFTHLTQAHDLTSFVITNPDRNLVYI